MCFRAKVNKERDLGREGERERRNEGGNEGKEEKERQEGKKVRAGAGMRHLDFILEVGKDTNGHQAGD